MNNVSTLPCETLKNAHRALAIPLSRERKSSVYSTLTVGSKFDRSESSWLQIVGDIAKEGVQNTRRWSGRTETATENRVSQLDYVVIAAAIRRRRRL